MSFSICKEEMDQNRVAFWKASPTDQFCLCFYPSKSQCSPYLQTLLFSQNVIMCLSKQIRFSVAGQQCVWHFNLTETKLTTHF